jgi:hypothetical protein
MCCGWWDLVFSESLGLALRLSAGLTLEAVPEWRVDIWILMAIRATAYSKWSCDTSILFEVPERTIAMGTWRLMDKLASMWRAESFAFTD